MADTTTIAVLIGTLLVLALAVALLLHNRLGVPAWTRPRTRSVRPRQQPVGIQRHALSATSVAPPAVPRRARVWSPRRRHIIRTPERLVTPLELVPHRQVLPDPPLGQGAIVSCTGHSAFFHGRCDAPDDVARLTVRGAVLRGLGHAMDETVGQDASGGFWHAAARTLYIAVADGLGSLSNSSTAAQTAIRQSLSRAPRRDRITDFAAHGPCLFGHVADAVAEAVRPVEPGGALTGATTLVIAEVRPVADGARVVVCGVGDSEAWLLDQDGWHSIHHERDTAEENSTRQLPCHPEPVIHSLTIGRGCVLVLASDGFAGALGTHRSSLAEELRDRWQVVPSPVEFLTHVNFVDEYWIDDRSAVAVWIG